MQSVQHKPDRCTALTCAPRSLRCPCTVLCFCRNWLSRPDDNSNYMMVASADPLWQSGTENWCTRIIVNKCIQKSCEFLNSFVHIWEKRRKLSGKSSIIWKKRANTKSFNELTGIFLVILSPKAVLVSFLHIELFRFCPFSQLSILPAPNIKLFAHLDCSVGMRTKCTFSFPLSSEKILQLGVDWLCFDHVIILGAQQWRVRDFDKVCFNPQEPTRTFRELAKTKPEVFLTMCSR